MMFRRALAALLLGLMSTMSNAATELGGGFNGQLGDISNALVLNSGVGAVRVFVDITRNYITYTTDKDAGCSADWCASGVLWSNICSQPKGDEMRCPTAPGGEAAAGVGMTNVLPVYAVSKLAAIRTLGCQTVTPPPVPQGQRAPCRNIRIILSLKTDFDYGPARHILEDGSFRSQQFVIDAVAALLQNGGLGGVIDDLVLGNEPMFEVPDGQADAYRDFLVALAGQVETQRKANGWRFRIFSGSFDRPGYACCPGSPGCPTTEPTPGCLNKAMYANAAAVIAATKTVNGAGAPFIIAGVDMHEHVRSVTDVARDVAWIRDRFAENPVAGFTPAFISTEFSLILWWQSQLNSGTPSLCSEINNLIGNAAQGTPVSGRSFARYLQRNPSVSPAGWFRQFYCALDASGFEVATYGLVRENQYPYQADLLNDGRCPVPTNEAGRITTTPWVMVSAYNGALLGVNTSRYPAGPTRDDPRPGVAYGLFNENPLVFPDFGRILADPLKASAARCP